MTAAAILTGLSQFLGSAAGQRTVNELIDRLHPEKRIDAAITGLPKLNPLPKGVIMADLKAVPTITMLAANTNGEPVGITWEEVVALLPAAIQLFATVKAAIAARPADEGGVIKGTYGFEAGAPALAALVRQIVTDTKD